MQQLDTGDGVAAAQMEQKASYDAASPTDVGDVSWADIVAETLPTDMVSRNTVKNDRESQSGRHAQTSKVRAP